MNLNKVSWKTTIVGVLLIAGGGWLCKTGQQDVGGLIVLAGLGLLGAKDYNKTHSK